MKKIPSFTIDHIRLLRGIYVSRKDEVNGEVITTFDIRMKEPNREPALGQGALHTIEHLAATYLRNEPQWQDKIIYWGPMGCLTGQKDNYRFVNYNQKDDLKWPPLHSGHIQRKFYFYFAFVAACGPLQTHFHE